MDAMRSAHMAWFAPALCIALMSSAATPWAATFPEFVDPNPAAGNQFGSAVVPLSTGNVVITSPGDDGGGSNTGAVYLFNGATGTLISTLRGSTTNDQIGSGGVTALSNGNYVISSPNWDNGGSADAGAVTWGSGTSGVSGVVNAGNSLVGSSPSDQVGGGGVTVLTNGNYVVLSPNANSGGLIDAGAATWGNGASGVSGPISSATSLVGSIATNRVGSGGAKALPNGNYVVISPTWDNGGVSNVGAVTWANGATGVSGFVSSANSLVGSTPSDQVGGSGLTVLTNGNYVVVSMYWDNGAIVNAGAVTWGSGTSGVSGAVSAANSLVGSTADDWVGINLVYALSNGNYVVASPLWDNGAVSNAGAATWASGTTGRTGAVSAANSLVGTTENDWIGNSVFVLPNGNYVTRSLQWANGAALSAGAVTWGDGTTGVTGAVSPANSLVGSTFADQIGSGGVTVLSNGNYVVGSPYWHNGAVSNAGAATWASGATGRSGTISAANSLVGSTGGDYVGLPGAVTALSNGNYVVAIPSWDNGAILDVGAVTWASGTTGASGAVSPASSLVGSVTGDAVGIEGVAALTNGNYVVRSSVWDNGAIVDAGAVTWGNGTSGSIGVVSAANSLVGSSASDNVGGVPPTALSDGNYVVVSPYWNHGVILDAGAATWGDGTTGVTGAITAANSLVGSTANDLVGNGGVTLMSNGQYVVRSANWDHRTFADAGAATPGDQATGVSGAVTADNSVVGWAANTNLLTILDDAVHGRFICRFLAEGGGRVRVGPNAPFLIESVSDVPNDQGGWLYLRFLRSYLDHAAGAPPVTMYGVWRLVPGTIPSHAGEVWPGAATDRAPEPSATARLIALLPDGLEARVADGRLSVTASGTRSPERHAGFPSGTWALVASVPAVQQDQYVAAIPTVSNAAPNEFVATAHTTTPWIWFITGAVSGQSVDNLAPAQPTQFTAAYSNGQTNLQWVQNTEHDLGGYSLYRGSSADFVPSPGNRIASQVATGYTDVGPAGRYYKLSAVDVNGNESGFALVTPEQTADAGDRDAPVAFALAGVRPNPASGHDLRVAFALPSGAPARLELLDVSGRRVVGRDVGGLGAGHHTVNLAEGRRVAAGIYWVRLTQGVNRQTIRAAVTE